MAGREGEDLNAQIEFGFDVEAKVDFALQSGKPRPLMTLERLVLLLLRRHQGAAYAIRAREICAEIEMQRGENGRRLITDVVQELRGTFGVPVGASKGKRAGYYLISTAGEYTKWLRSYESQIRQSARVLRALRGARIVEELFGQIQMDFRTLDQKEAA